MRNFEALALVDRGANFYLHCIGDAAHMALDDNGLFETMRPNGDVNDLSSLFNLRLGALSDGELHRVIGEVRAKRIHTWWPLAASERVLSALYPDGKRPVYAESDLETYAVMLPGELPAAIPPPSGFTVRIGDSLAAFSLWCELDNRLEHGGKRVFHPKNHLHLLDEGKMTCFLGFFKGEAVSTCAILSDGGAASLEFVSTEPKFRRRGFAAALCDEALAYAFGRGASSVSVRAVGDGRFLGARLGFRYLTGGVGD
ncbi:MAG: GNAT family N-acetyltransferase [Christensenellaceae bacterium]|jgi:GNAT superfamily N-acetyltransferase|nr:GNAT family N-acetyltransferase [Christensenellaceae bacterium]